MTMTRPPKLKPVVMWIVQAPNSRGGWFNINGTCSNTREEAKRCFGDWQVGKDYGYRVIKVRVTPI